MKTAGDWFEEGMKAIGMSYTADYRSEWTSDHETAVAAFDQALALEPSHLRALVERGLALAKLDQHEAALDSFVAAVTQAPRDADLRVAVGQSLMKLGQYGAAVPAFDEVLRLRAGDGEALYGRARALKALERDALALADWDALLALPDTFHHLEARLSRAVALARLGRPEARAAFAETFEADAVTLRGMSPPPVFSEALRTLKVARTAYRAYVEAHAGELPAVRGAASAWGKAGRIEESLAAWAEVVQRAPGDAHAWYGKAEAHALAGQLAPAIAAHERSLELWPGFLGAAARLQVLKAQREAEAGEPPRPSGPWRVMGSDTFAREEFVVGEFATKELAQARLAELEQRAASQDESVRDSYWLVPPS